jgi:hypothetical protein
MYSVWAIDAEAPLFADVCDASNFVNPRSSARVSSHVPHAHEDTQRATDNVDVQTLRGRRKTPADSPPRRIVVLRTRYPTQRPDSSSGRRASDEPDD